nr:acyltransferase family protein [Jiangella gansuensis]
MATVAGSAVLSSAPADTGQSRFRADIEGLRAVAVGLVLAYHAGLPLVSGGFVGVDVFFVISGFLITGLILREIETTGRLRLARFYARRIRRLLPATAVVLGATAALTVALLPPVRWAATAGDIAASATYLVNWRLAGDTVDYLAADAPPSPVQHFWSLAVEEQFYLAWPLLIIAVIWAHRRHTTRRGRGGCSPRRVLLAALAAITVPSLAWSIHLSATAPGPAYFITTTRAWELGIGAAIALSATRLTRLPHAAATVLAWTGLGAIATAAITYNATTTFPGHTALLPVLGTAAVITAGLTTTHTTPGRLLSTTPMRFIGALSYSLYLWHWPLLIAATAAFGELTPAQGLGVVTASLVPAWLTHRLVEAPIHHARALATHPARAFAVGATATAIALTAAFLTTRAIPDYDTPTHAPGAAALGPDPATDPDARPVDHVTAMTPDPVHVPDDNADVYADGCHQSQTDAEILMCAYGDLDSDRVVALVGDSHAAQWQPALEEVASRNGWRLETYTKSACGFFSVDVINADGAPYTSCTEWNDVLLDELTGPDRPDLVITTGSNSYRVAEDGHELGDDESSQRLAAGMRDSWHAVRDAGVDLAVIRNTPWLGNDPAECISENPDRLTTCAEPTDDALDRSGDTQVLAVQELGGIDLIDLNEAICPTDTCPAVIGNVVVWRDSHHLTATYARTLAPRLEESLAPFLS